MAEWRINPQVVLQLLDAYKKYQCLWNFKCEEYRHANSRTNAWQRLAEMFDTTPEMVKLKIKYLRTAYVSERRKVEASKKSGDPNALYRPRLFYYRKFNFLDPVIFLRGTSNDKRPIRHRIELTADDGLRGDPYEHSEHSDNSKNSELMALEAMCAIKAQSNSSEMTLNRYDDDTLASNTECDNEATVANSSHQEPKNFKWNDDTGESLQEFKKFKWTNPPEEEDEQCDIITPTTRDSAERSNNVGQANFSPAENDHKNVPNDLCNQFGKTVALQLAQLLPLEATSAMATMHRYLSKKIIRSMRRREMQDEVRRKSRRQDVEKDTISSLGDSSDEYL